MNELLTKLFVHVPKELHETLDNVIAKSKTNNKKIYFVEEFNQIVLNGTTYGIDPKTSKEIVSLINVIGGKAGPDGTVTVDFSNLNYYTSEGTKTIIGAIEAIYAKVNTEMAKLAASNTINESYEFIGKIKYVAAKDGVAAHIALVGEDETRELSTINVSDIIGNGVLDHSEYVKETGILHLYFKQADGSTKDAEINLAEMLDIDDVLVKSGSENYLEVVNTTKISRYRLIAEPHTEITVEEYNALPEGEKANYEAINEQGFEIGTKVKKIVGAGKSADLTGLADAADVKAYVDSMATDLAITAEGDDYVGASVNADVDKKHVIVAANVNPVTYTPGTHATYNGEGAVDTQATPANITGIAKSLVDGAQAITAIKSYIDFVAEEESRRADAKVLASIKGLDVTAQTKGTNVHVTVSETDGKVALDSVVEDYATVTRVASTSTSAAHATNASLTVTEGDEAKLVKASDIKAVADYAADKVKEEEHRVDNLVGSYTGVDTGKYISVKVDSKGGKVSYVTVEFDPWETYKITQSDLQ